MTFISERSISKGEVDLERVPFYVETYCWFCFLFRYIHTIRSGAIGYSERFYTWSSSTASSIFFVINMFLPSTIVAFCLVLGLLNGVFLKHVCLFFLFSIILFHYLFIHLIINITLLKNACKCVTTHVVPKLICCVRFFIIFNQWWQGVRESHP